MREIKILNRHFCTVIITQEPIEENLRDLYPFDLTSKIVIKKKLAYDSKVLCFICSDIKSDQKFLSTTLFIMNRYDSGIFAVKTHNFIEIVEMSNSKLISSKLIDEKNFDSKKYTLITEEKICNTYNSHDCIVLNSSKYLLKRNLVIFFSITIFFVMIFILFNFIIGLHEAQLKSIVKAEEISKLEKEREIKTIEECKKLKIEYEKCMKEKTSNVYQMLSHLYECIGKNITVENLTIDRNSFYIDVITKDAVKILNKFENNKSIQNIKMNRITIQNDKEYVSYNGFFQKFIIYPQTDDIFEQVQFYKNKLQEYEKRLLLKSKKSVSEYSDTLRKLLREKNCKEDYMQTKLYNDKIFLEVSLNAKSENLLSFIQYISKNDYLIDIQGINLKNNQIYTNVNATFLFDTGIIHDKGNELISNSDNQASISERDFGSSFYKKPNYNASVRKAVSTTLSRTTEKSKITFLQNKNLQYVGEAKVGKSGYMVFVKDVEFGNLYKLPLVENLGDSNACKYLTKNSYEVVINKKHYEVKK